jgi:hypothetical protein
MDCAECVRREHRLIIAKADLESAQRKYQQSPSKGNEFAIESAELYMREILASHPQHPRKA